MALFLIAIVNILVLNSISFSIRSSKQAELISATSEYSTSLSAYGLDYALNLPKNLVGVNRRVIVTDASYTVTFDSSRYENSEGKTLFLPATLSALRGDEYFSIDTASALLESCASLPIVSNGKIVGTVCVFETDLSLQKIFATTRRILIATDILILLFALISAFAIISAYITRTSTLIKTVRKAHDSDEIEKIPIEYNDELAPIIREFNTIYERLNYVQQMRQVFVSDASHELRTPLAAIKLLCESITQTDNVDAETAKEFMEDIILEVDRMSHTAEKLLVLSKLDNANRSALAPISLSHIVRKTITTLEPIAADKNVTIKSYIEDDCSILADMEGANQIISNLIDNAIKYNNEGGTLRIYLFSRSGKCTFITDDTGIGIAPEFREQVFERFYRVDKSREHDGRGGSGLGLSIVKRNVEAFGGTIKISDSVNGGTRFTVVFPSLITEEEVDILC